MKILTVLIALVLFACTHPTPPAKPAPTPNLALAFVHKVDVDVPCEPFFTDVGQHHVHSVVCKLPTKQVVYCTVSDESWPSCKAIDGSDQPPRTEGPGAPPKAEQEPPPVAPPPPPKAKGK